MSNALPPTTRVSLERTDFPYTSDQLLWEVIKDRTEALSFRRYTDFIDRVMSDVQPSSAGPSSSSSSTSPVSTTSATPPTKATAADKARAKAIRTAQATLADKTASADDRAEAEATLASLLDQQLDTAPVASPTGDLGDETLYSQYHPKSQKAPGSRQLPQDVQTLRTKISAYGVFNGDAYSLLKAATDFFVLTEAGRLEDVGFIDPPSTYLSLDLLNQFRDDYLQTVTTELGTGQVLPYLDIIRNRLSELPVKENLRLGVRPDSYGILRSRLMSPVLLELIWNYWIEQGMMVQTINLIALRFQNVRRGNGVDPLANFELDPLRPLGNLLWGYVQDEVNRLSVNRRCYEYAHGLGLQLVGKAVPTMHPADVRSQFLPAFHDLLRLAWIFFREDDDKTVVADAFPMLNALRELHFVISEGAHNQFVDLTMRARSEMLMQQWLLARPEMKDFLRGRTMVPYPEEWMDRVDAMKALQQWNDASVINYGDLAAFGEKILLSVRYGDWSTTTDQNQAANWARAFRPEMQRYTHALKIVSSIDLSTSDVVEVRTETERMQQGVVSRTPRMGGVFHPVASPVAQQVGARPGAANLLKPAPVPVAASIPAQVPTRRVP